MSTPIYRNEQCVVHNISHSIYGPIMDPFIYVYSHMDPLWTHSYTFIHIWTHYGPIHIRVFIYGPIMDPLWTHYGPIMDPSMAPPRGLSTLKALKVKITFFLMSHEIGVCLTDRSSSKRRFTNIRYQKHSQRPHPACHMQADRDLETNQVDG